MRKWFWSIIMAVIGFVVGIWWLREREVTTPALKTWDHTPPPPAEPETSPVEADETPAAKTEPVKAEPEAEAPAESPYADAADEQDASAPDDLTAVNGIGPAFETALNGIGIMTYAQLAEQTPAELAERLDARGISAERIERDGWIEQARRLANT